jgi:hypothetical protein
MNGDVRLKFNAADGRAVLVAGMDGNSREE